MVRGSGKYIDASIRVSSRLLCQESSRPSAAAVGILGERGEMGSDGADSAAIWKHVCAT